MTNKITTCVAIGGLALFMTGCWQKAIHPFYRETDLISEPRLASPWMEHNEQGKKSATWTFTQSGEKEYKLVIVDGDERYEFDARLFKLGETKFLDLYSRKRSISEVPAHSLQKIRLSEDTLELTSMNVEWTRKWLSAHKDEIAHVRVDDPEEPLNEDKAEFVLTAPTAELQKFVLAHKDASGFFNDPMTLKREH